MSPPTTFEIEKENVTEKMENSLSLKVSLVGNCRRDNEESSLASNYQNLQLLSKFLRRAATIELRKFSKFSLHLFV